VIDYPRATKYPADFAKVLRMYDRDRKHGMNFHCVQRPVGLSDGLEGQ
jgi:hypothetical protein